MAGDRGTIAAATTSTYATRAKSNQRFPVRAIAGRTTHVRMIVAAASRYAIQSYPPANANSVMPRRPAITPEPAKRSDRGFGVVILVLVAAGALIVVLVSREVDLVQHDGGEPRVCRHDGIERALGEAAPRHLRADHESD